MKKILSISLLFCYIVIKPCEAQNVGERGISTNPIAPVNPDVNSPAGGGNGATTPTVLNNFYWFNTNTTSPFNNKFFNFTYNNGADLYTTSSIINPYFLATVDHISLQTPMKLVVQTTAITCQLMAGK
jgi:hypothetical protein